MNVATDPPSAFADIEAEQATLGAVLLDATTLPVVRVHLAWGDFASERHQAISRAVWAVYDRGDGVDILTVRAELERAGMLAKAGGVDYLTDLMLSTPAAVSAEHYARIVAGCSRRRRLREGLTLALGQLEDGRSDLTDVEAAVDRARQANASQPTLRRMRDLITDVATDLSAMQASGGIVGMRTGIGRLDSMLGGLRPGHLVILAARPALGKTSLATQMVWFMSQQGARSLLISAEMPSPEIVTRMVCAAADTDDVSLRTYGVTQKVSQAFGQLADLPMWVDDQAAITTTQIRSRARYLAAQGGLDVIAVDYVGMLGPEDRRQPRVEQIAGLTRDLKALAKELRIPVILLSQLNRQSEQDGRRPRLSDLRDSGCLTADTPVFLPDTGEYKAISDTKPGDRVLAINPQTWKSEARAVLAAFSTGTKPVLRLTTASGRTMCATGNHPVLTVDGWRRLDAVIKGEHIATPRHLPSPTEATMSHDQVALLGHLIGDGCVLPRHVVQYTTADEPLARIVADLARAVFGDRIAPRINRERNWFQVYLASTGHLTHRTFNPVAGWFRELGIFGLRSHEKRIPSELFTQPRQEIGTFLRHLWSTDGTIHIRNGKRGPSPAVRYFSSSPELARGVQSLLLRFGITATVNQVPQKRGRMNYHVTVTGADVSTFLSEIGALRPSAVENVATIQAMDPVVRNTNRDVVPASVWRTEVLPVVAKTGGTHRDLAMAMGRSYNGNARYRSNLSREHAKRVAGVVGSPSLLALAESDVYWDQVASVVPAGEAEVWDLTVDGLHNFAAGDTFVHNSLEQDADVVLFLWRDKTAQPRFDGRQDVELIVAKHRGGPRGVVPVVFDGSRFTFAEV